MPVRLDEVDLAILKALFEDGRASVRSLAREVGVSPPTVEQRLAKMKSLGLVKGFIPLIDCDKLEGFMFIAMLKIDIGKLDAVLKELLSIEGIMSVSVLSGEHNLAVRLFAISRDDLHRLMSALSRYGYVHSTHVILKTVSKPDSLLEAMAKVSIKAKCEYCGQEVGGKHYTLRIGRYVRFFCCKSCLKLFRQKYKRGISAVIKRSNRSP